MRAASPAAAVVLAALSCMAGPAAAQQSGAAQSAASWYAAYQRDSRLVRLPDGRQLNIYCVGQGAPTVILEAGIGGWAYDWRSVQGRLAERTRVCAYDRAGMGLSPPAPNPRDTRAQVSDLEALLRAGKIPGPYVLVGHSMGGFNVRLFASRHQREIAGVVLVDPSVENQIEILHASSPATASSDARQVAQLRACADSNRTQKTAEDCTRRAPKDFPPDLATKYVAAHGLTYIQTVHAEVESFINVASHQVAAERRQLGATPLVVLTRGERSDNLPAAEAATEWHFINQMHADLARLSTAGSHRVVEGAGHYIQLDKPDAVVAAVDEVLDAARRRP